MAATIMMRSRGQILRRGSSLFRRVSSLSPPSQCCSIRPLSALCQNLRIASLLSNARLELRGASISGSRSSRLSSLRASHQVSDASSIDSNMMQAMETKIKEQLNAETVIVKDAYGDGRHVSIYIVSSAFEGQSAVNRQRMVYKAIWEELQSTVHAVDQMITNTPAEANKNQ